MKGIANLRPSVPRYAFIWDIEQVLKYLKSCIPLHFRSEKELSLKLTMLLALLSARRENEIQKLDICIGILGI